MIFLFGVGGSKQCKSVASCVIEEGAVALARGRGSCISEKKGELH